MILQDLLTELSALQENESECKIYLFGSVLRDSSYSSDLDLLILYEHTAELELLKQWLRPICLRYPIDLVCMTPNEEAQLDFIANQQATPINELIG